MATALSRADRFKSDVYVDDGDDLSEYGFNAKVLYTPGHSQGSISILTDDGDLFCGDLLLNLGEPVPPTNIDDSADLKASLEKLRGLEIKMIYPGHGKPFLPAAFANVS